MIRKNDAARFASYIEVTPDGCHVWIGGKATGGYGKFSVNRKTVMAHRYAYEQARGEIPQGLQLDHLCRNRPCCNPEHLEAVTCRENLLRGETLQAENAAKTKCPRGHDYSEANTYRYPDGRRRCITCRRIDDNAPRHRERRVAYKRMVRAAKKSKHSAAERTVTP